MSLQGILSTYPLPESSKPLSGSGEKRPYFTSGDVKGEKALVFIGGLFNGMNDVPYVFPLSAALEKEGWRFVQIHWQGAYQGYGTGSLDRDVAELSSLIKHIREKDGVKQVVIMGHSTGSQDVIHYLTSPPSESYKYDRQPVSGGIMQAPASDRQYFAKNDSAGWCQEWNEQIPIAKKLIAEGKGDQLMDQAFWAQAGCPISAYRLFSLVGIGGDDDYFSSDIPDEGGDTPHVHPLSSSFGKLEKPALALWSEKDECGFLENQQDLLDRWVKAANGKLVAKIVKGATHGVPEKEAQDELVQIVLAWIKENVE